MSEFGFCSSSSIGNLLFNVQFFSSCSVVCSVMFSYVPLRLVCVCVFPYMVVLLDNYGYGDRVVPSYLRAAIVISWSLPPARSVLGLDTRTSLPWSWLCSPDGFGASALSYLLRFDVFLWVRSLILERVWTLVCGLAPELRSYAGSQTH